MIGVMPIPPGDQEMALGPGREREVVARHRPRDEVAHANIFVQPARAGPFAQHGDAIVPAFGRVVPQGEIPHEPLGEPH